MEYTAGIFGISFLICVAGVFFYLQSEKNAYKQLLEKAEAISLEYKTMQKELQTTNARIDEYRNLFLTFKRETNDNIYAAQDHCARLREQQQILSKRQAALRSKMIPNKVELEIVGPEKNKAIFNKVKQQLKGLQ